MWEVWAGWRFWCRSSGRRLESLGRRQSSGQTCQTWRWCWPIPSTGLLSKQLSILLVLVSVWTGGGGSSSRWVVHTYYHRLSEPHIDDILYSILSFVLYVILDLGSRTLDLGSFMLYQSTFMLKQCVRPSGSQLSCCLLAVICGLCMTLVVQWHSASRFVVCCLFVQRKNKKIFFVVRENVRFHSSGNQRSDVASVSASVSAADQRNAHWWNSKLLGETWWVDINKLYKTQEYTKRYKTVQWSWT